MSLTTLPKKAIALEYRALSLPARLVETQLVARLLAEDSALRLSYERALGAFDAAVGRLLGDAELSRRGAALRQRTEVLQRAARLEAEAAERRERADSELQDDLQQAAQRRTEAAQRASEETAQARREREEAEQRIAQEADQREQAERERIQREADQRAEQTKATLQAERDRIAAEEEAATAAPKAQLDDAVSEQQTAAEKRRKADRLATHAAQENLARQQERAERQDRATG